MSTDERFVSNIEDFHSVVEQMILDGYIITESSGSVVTLLKRKRWDWSLALLSFGFFGVGLIAYAVYYFLIAEDAATVLVYNGDEGFDRPPIPGVRREPLWNGVEWLLPDQMA